MFLWTAKRWSTFCILCTMIAVLLSFSIPSSIAFYNWIFGDMRVAVGLMAIIDVVCLVTYCMHLANIHTRITFLHNITPFASAVPLYHLFNELAAKQLSGYWPITVSIGATGLIVALSFYIYKSIEDLFIDPVQLAEERATHHMQGLLLIKTQYDAMQRVMIEVPQKAKELEVTQEQQRLLISPAKLTREKFRIAFNVPQKNVTEAKRLYDMGEDFSHLCKK